LSKNHETYGKETVEWYTPEWIFKGLGLEFDLDPCHPEEKLPWVPAKKTYCKKEGGLTKDWGDSLVWLNPPYGIHTHYWMKKMHKHRKGVALVAARVDCAWFHDYVTKADAILFFKGRVRFIDGTGKTEGSSPGNGSIMVAWGEESIKALQRMEDKGFIIIKGGDYI
jgi:phage N-6-adenine-methyltransferase